MSQSKVFTLWPMRSREGEKEKGIFEALQGLKFPYRPPLFKVATIFYSSKVKANCFNMRFFERHLDPNYGSTEPVRIYICGEILLMNQAQFTYFWNFPFNARCWLSTGN